MAIHTFADLTGAIADYSDAKDNKVLENLASVEENVISTRTYNEGEYLTYNNTIYEVIDDIAVGDTLVIYPATGANIKVSEGIMTLIGYLSTNKEDKATILFQTLAIGSTSVTFTNLPTTGNHLIDFFTSNGINYTEIDTSTAGQVTLTFDEQDVAVTVYCKISEV